MSSARTAPVLVCIGDSITAGTYLAPTDRWPARLGSTLCGWQVVNAGIGGNTVIAPPPAGQQTMTDRFQTDVLDVPGVAGVIILGGINDCGWVDATTICQALENLVNRAAAAGLAWHVCTLTPLQTSWPSYNGIEGYRESVNTWLRAFYGGPPGLLDFDADLRTPQADLLDPVYSYDGLHPNAFGAVRLADLARRYVP